MRALIQKIQMEKFLRAFFFAASVLFFVSCSSESYTQDENSEKKTGEQTLSFADTESGTTVHYNVNFKDGKILSIYKNNELVPENEIENYKDLVYDKLDSITAEDDHPFHHKPFVFHFDSDEFKENMKEWKEKLKAENFNFKFDHENFKKDMEKLKEELKGMDDIVIEIDKDKIKNDLDECLKNLDDIKINKFNFDFDEDKLNDNLKQITIEIEKNHDEHELNMKELEKEMEKLESKMSKLSGEMENLDKEMKTLNEFLDDAKNEMVKDGLIKNKDEKFELELNANEMKVNGEKVPDSIHLKYKKLYKQRFNKELDSKIKVKI